MTTTTLRPDGTVVVDGSVTGAATAHAATSDDSDASYFTQAGVLDIGTVTLGSDVTKTLALRVRAQSATLANQDITATATGPVSVVATGSVGAAAAATISGAPLAISYSQAQIDAIQVSLVGPRPGAPNGHVNARFLELFVDLVHVARPLTVVTAVTPDPYTASNIVPIAWTNTLDADGGVQTRYQIRVFTAAQYGIGGFDPATSPATQDTGEVVGAALTRNTAVLSTATTFRAYVRVAQTVNGVSHWSAYAFDQFEVAVTTSDVDAVTAAGSAPGAYIQVTVNRDTGSSAWNFVEIERSIDNGATWSPVRGATYVDSTGNANTFTVTDYETGNGQAVLYRARATRIVSTLPITGAWVQSTPSASWSSTSAWLKSPANPSKNLIVDVDTPFVSTNLPVRVGVFDIVGSAERVVISDVMSAPASTLMIRTEPSDTALLVLLRDLVLLYHPTICEGGTTARYISVTGVSFTPTVINGHVYQLWTVPYVEIDAPRDPLASAP